MFRREFEPARHSPTAEEKERAAALRSARKKLEDKYRVDFLTVYPLNQNGVDLLGEQDYCCFDTPYPGIELKIVSEVADDKGNLVDGLLNRTATVGMVSVEGQEITRAIRKSLIKFARELDMYDRDSTPSPFEVK